MISNIRPLLPLFESGRAIGLQWYERAENELRAVADLAAWDLDRLVSVTCVLSPKVAVRRNLRLSFHYLETGQLLAGVVRSVRQSLDNYERTGKIVGPKISAFRAALLGDRQAVVSDVWIARAVRIRQEELKRRPVRESVDVLFRRLSDRTGYSPRDCQAAVWCGIILLHGRTVGPFPVWEEYRRFIQSGRRFINGPIG
jgi:hypothetical protein